MNYCQKDDGCDNRCAHCVDAGQQEYTVVWHYVAEERLTIRADSPLAALAKALDGHGTADDTVPVKSLNYHVLRDGEPAAIADGSGYVVVLVN